jgi:hypothetical protein
MKAMKDYERDTEEEMIEDSLKYRNPMRNKSLMQQDGNGDTNSDTGYAHSKSRNYSTPYGTNGNFAPFVAENHIMPGSHITVPRDEGPMRNSLNAKKQALA